MKDYKSFTDLDVWKRSRAWRIEMWLLCKHFPKEEKYRLADQLIRASRSIPANIAEGHGRFHFQETIQYCRIARGSLMECIEHLICAYDCEYIELKILKKYKMEGENILKLINGYLSFLQKQKSSK